MEWYLAIAGPDELDREHGKWLYAVVIIVRRMLASLPQWHVK